MNLYIAHLKAARLTFSVVSDVSTSCQHALGMCASHARTPAMKQGGLALPDKLLQRLHDVDKSLRSGDGDLKSAAHVYDEVIQKVFTQGEHVPNAILLLMGDNVVYRIFLQERSTAQRFLNKWSGVFAKSTHRTVRYSISKYKQSSSPKCRTPGIDLLGFCPK